MLALAGAGVAVGAIVWPFIDSMEPAADTLAAGEPIDVDVSKLAPGQQIVVVWRGKPIFIVHRTPQGLATLQDPKVTRVLSDPNSKVLQQPEYAENWHRSVDPAYAVMVGICTHLGCVPTFYPNMSATDPAPDWPGGYLCPCHGSKYDLAARRPTPTLRQGPRSRPTARREGTGGTPSFPIPVCSRSVSCRWIARRSRQPWTVPAPTPCRAPWW